MGRKNPPGEKWRKKAVLNWARYAQRFGHARREGTEAKKKHMDKRQFRCWGKYKEGWDTDEIEDEGLKRKNDMTVERDYQGKNGALRLEIDKGQQKHSVNEKFLEAVSVEESDAIKAPKQEDLEALLQPKIEAGTEENNGEKLHLITIFYPGKIYRGYCSQKQALHY